MCLAFGAAKRADKTGLGILGSRIKDTGAGQALDKIGDTGAAKAVEKASDSGVAKAGKAVKKNANQALQIARKY